MATPKQHDLDIKVALLQQAVDSMSKNIQEIAMSQKEIKGMFNDMRKEFATKSELSEFKKDSEKHREDIKKEVGMIKKAIGAFLSVIAISVLAAVLKTIGL